MSEPTETVEEFRLRVREWLAANMPLLAPDAPPPDRAEDDETWARDKELQRMLWDGGLAGICFPKEFGGLGLTIEYQHAFTEESLPYEMPLHLNVPHFSILGATLVDFGTPEQNAKYLPPMLRGEQQWVQFLSEPTGGSDLAGCLTRAERDGDEWVMNGSKIWSTAAMSATHAMCLARTDWDAPKHRGLTMFIMEIHQEGVQVDPIKQVNGSLEFCQEFFDDVRLPPDSVVGEVNDGWTVALALLAHERNAVGGGSPYVSGRNYLAEGADGAFDASSVKIVTARGTSDDPVARQLLAEAHVLDVVQRGLVKRVSLGMETGALVGQSAAITKLFTATSAERKTTIRLELAGPDALTWPTGDRDHRSRRGRGLPGAPGDEPRRRQQRDPAQPHRRAGARHATRVGGRPRHPVQGRPQQHDAHVAGRLIG